MIKRDLLTYHHTQKAPWFLLLFCFAALCFTIVWVTKAEPVLPAILLVSGLMMAIFGYSFQQLTVADEGDWLAIRFGPLPLFKRRIRYDDIQEVGIGRTTVLNGWGIHLTLRGGWIWSLSAGNCVVIRHRRGTISVGTNDAQGLVEFLKDRKPRARDNL
jgi:hypothetical protein